MSTQVTNYLSTKNHKMSIWAFWPGPFLGRRIDQVTSSGLSSTPGVYLPLDSSPCRSCGHWNSVHLKCTHPPLQPCTFSQISYHLPPNPPNKQPPRGPQILWPASPVRVMDTR